MIKFTQRRAFGGRKVHSAGLLMTLGLAASTLSRSTAQDVSLIQQVQPGIGNPHYVCPPCLPPCPPITDVDPSGSTPETASPIFDDMTAESQPQPSTADVNQFAQQFQQRGGARRPEFGDVGRFGANMIGDNSAGGGLNLLIGSVDLFENFVFDPTEDAVISQPGSLAVSRLNISENNSPILPG